MVNGSVAFSEGFGYRDVERKLPVSISSLKFAFMYVYLVTIVLQVTPTTLFNIGSCSKAFTSTLVVRLVLM
jgi:CubicO group peptidase (beta-lactamase class C family)